MDMQPALDLPTLEFRLQHAMALVRQDRWLLGAVRDGKLKVLADSSPELHRPYRRTRALSHLARRCLHERQPLTVSSLGTAAEQRHELPIDWELDWPALLYAPVGMPARRPVGLLVMGSRTTHWYQQQEIDYAAALGVTLTGLALALGGPLTRLSDRERRTAHLIAQGLSLPETSIALRVGHDEARDLVHTVLRKLSVRSPGQLVDCWPRLESTAGYP
jgi:DNA-binding CsgD family transcriptional regulator